MAKFAHIRVYGADWTLVRSHNRPFIQSETGVVVVGELTDVVPGQHILMSTLSVLALVSSKSELGQLAAVYGNEEDGALVYRTDTETFHQWTTGPGFAPFVPVAPALPSGGGGGSGATYQGVEVTVVRLDSLATDNPNVYGDTGGDFDPVAGMPGHWRKAPYDANNGINIILHENLPGNNAQYAYISDPDLADEIAAAQFDEAGFIQIVVTVNADNATFDWSIPASGDGAAGLALGQF